MELEPSKDAPDARDLALGHGPMDDVHRDFVAGIHALRRAGESETEAALGRLAQLTREHFEAEERWMAETDYPALDCHADEHAAVLRSVAGVQQRVATGDLAAARVLADALLEWFPGHSDYMDAALAHWLCKRRLGGVPVVVRRRAAAAA